MKVHRKKPIDHVNLD